MIGFDTETHLIEPGLLVPPMVCLSLGGAGDDIPDWARPSGALVRKLPDAWLTLLDRQMAVEAVPHLLRQPCIGHNTAYDLAELAEAHREATGTDTAIRLVFEGLTEARIFDTKIREQLLCIANDELDFIAGPDGIEKTTFSLSALVRRYLGVDISESKSDPNAWRLRYRELDGVPLDMWPTEAVDYALLDAYWPLRVAAAQVRRPAVVDGFQIHDSDFSVFTESREVAAAFALHLMGCWGLRTNPEYVAETIAEWRAGSESGIRLGERLGFIRVKGRDKGKPGSVDKAKLSALVTDAYHGAPPCTAPSVTYPLGQVQTSTEVLRDSGNPDLKLYSETLQFTNWLGRYAPELEAATQHPYTSSPNVLVSSGRTSWGLQQPPRSGGFRGCHVPRQGWLYASADYDFLELCTVSQVCIWLFGRSTLADTINAGKDPHIAMAVEILKAYDHPEAPADYDTALARRKDPVIKEHRQLAKPANFGLWGGLGPETFVEYAHATYGIDMSVERAAELRAIWKAVNPEADEYFRHVTRQIEYANTVQQYVSGRVRGGVRFTSACNTYFQGLAADGAKYATFLVSRACYSEPASPLYGCRPVLFVHDEIIIEAPEDRAVAAAHELARIMVAGMKEHVPDVRIGAKPVLTRRWMKGADPTYRDGALTVTESET